MHVEQDVAPADELPLEVDLRAGLGKSIVKSAISIAFLIQGDTDTGGLAQTLDLGPQSYLGDRGPV